MAAHFVRIDAIITDCVFGFGRDVVDDGGEEISGLENLEVAHGGEDIGTQRPHGGTVAFFIAGKEGVPSGSDDLPERRGAGAAGLIDGRHKECS